MGPRQSGTPRTSASLVRLVIEGLAAGAVVALIIRTGWPMSLGTTILLGLAFSLWLVANVAAQPALVGARSRERSAMSRGTLPGRIRRQD